MFVAMEVENDTAAAHTGDPIYSGENLVGVVTSGGYGFALETSIAMGYVETSLADVGTKLSVGILGDRYDAIVRAEPMFDPAHELPRADA